ncbi:MAG: peptidylprolyl isomerase, partial [Verrucomicrobiota bacterium]
MKIKTFLTSLTWLTVLIFSATIHAGATSPITASTFRINSGELIVRSRTVLLTIDAASSQGKITAMQLGDSVSGQLGNMQPYKTSMPYTVTGTATGAQVIYIRFLDSKGTLSDQYTVPVHILADFPLFPALTTGTTPTISIRRGSYSWVKLTPAVVDTGDPIVRFSTNSGDILMRLYPSKAPLTVANFLNYVNNNAYDYSFIHRSVPGFVIQGGGWFVDTNNNYNITAITTYGTVANEFGDSNTRGTVAMAKLAGDPNSATDEWFVNLADNSTNLDNQNGGFTVFGKVLDSSMPVIDGIAGF